jgi:dipeptidyl aminopeptidase/acylaminoacyl peptidase
MTLASAVHFSDRLKCGIDEVGISNWVTFLKNTQAYRQDLRRAKYGDEREPKLREYGYTVCYIEGKDEGHGFAKKPNRDHQSWAEILLLERYLFE